VAEELAPADTGLDLDREVARAGIDGGKVQQRVAEAWLPGDLVGVGSRDAGDGDLLVGVAGGVWEPDLDAVSPRGELDASGVGEVEVAAGAGLGLAGTERRAEREQGGKEGSLRGHRISSGQGR